MELSPAEQVALAGVVKDKALTDAKRCLQEGSATQVDFTVRIQGSVQKGVGTPAAEFEKEPAVSLRAPAVFFSALRSLGIGATRFQRALQGVQADAPDDAEFNSVVTAEEQRRAQAMPKVTGKTPAKAGAVQSQVTATRV